MSDCCGCDNLEARTLDAKERRVLITVLAINIGTFLMMNPGIPVVELMGVAAVLNLGANAVCLWLLTPYRHGDVNMASAWECSRNDIYEGSAVILATIAVRIFGTGWPDLSIAMVLLALFARSAGRVIRNAWQQMRGGGLASA